MFAKQHRRILRIRDEVDIVISDSPLIMSLMYYNEEMNLVDKGVYTELVFNAFNKYPNMNFFLNRDLNLTYQENGRNQTRRQALLLDERIKCFLEAYTVKYTDLHLSNAGDIAIATIAHRIVQQTSKSYTLSL